MADRIIREEEAPREREVIREVDRSPTSQNNTVGVVIGVIVVLFIVWLLFGGGLG